MALILKQSSGIMAIVDVNSSVDASLLLCCGYFLISFVSPGKSRDDVIVITLSETDSREWGARAPPPAPPLHHCPPPFFCKGVFFEKLLKISDNGFVLSISLSNT